MKILETQEHFRASHVLVAGFPENLFNGVASFEFFLVIVRVRCILYRGTMYLHLPSPLVIRSRLWWDLQGIVYSEEDSNDSGF